MKKSLKYIIAGCLIVAIAGCVYAFFHANRETAAASAEEVYFPKINEATQAYEASWAYDCSTLSQQYDNAHDIVVASVVGNTKAYTDGTVDFTNTDVKVMNSLKGDLSSGDTITIVETGKALSDNSDLSVDGAPLLKKDMEVVLFLQENEDHTYCILDDYLGKYFVDANGSVTQAGDMTAQDHMTVSDFKKGTSLDDFIKQIGTLSQT